MRKKVEKDGHPLAKGTIPNKFYFVSNKPEEYNAANYFKTFADLHSSKKDLLHAYWKAVLDILEASSIRRFQTNGQRLKAQWNTPSKGLGDFWERLKERESVEDQVMSTTATLKKRAIQSAENHTLKAFNALEKNLSFDENYEDLTSRRKQSMQDQDDASRHSCADADSAGATVQPIKAAINPVPAIYYLAGGGNSDCSSKRRSPYVINGVDISELLWAYRSKILERAEKMESLESVERLVVNNIFLVDQGDFRSSLFHALGAKHWATISKSTLQTKVTKEMLSEIGMKAVEISRMTHQDAQEYVDSTASDKKIKRLLTSLFEDSFLWGDADFNELELLQHLFNPFLKTFFGGMPSCKGRWDKAFEPSRDRRQMDDPTATGRRPDYFMELILPGLACYLMVLEAKKSRQTSPTQTDTEKVANLLKDSIDHMARAAVDVSKINLFGLVIVGEKALVYTMDLPAKGLYIMRTYAVFYVPRSKDDLAVIGTAMDVLMNLKTELEVLVSQCEAPRLSRPSDRTTTSYRTPQKVERTGVPVVRADSPSIRAEVNRISRA